MCVGARESPSDLRIWLVRTSAHVKKRKGEEESLCNVSAVPVLHASHRRVLQCSSIGQVGGGAVCGLTTGGQTAKRTTDRHTSTPFPSGLRSQPASQSVESSLIIIGVEVRREVMPTKSLSGLSSFVGMVLRWKAAFSPHAFIYLSPRSLSPFSHLFVCTSCSMHSLLAAGYCCWLLLLPPRLLAALFVCLSVGSFAYPSALPFLFALPYFSPSLSFRVWGCRNL
ncbi:uncharacterized protein J3D65DRAFT_231553 [Phyllosticta citribraziliensis]|uniref:Transmembrane protein n=1 Tax=Phyllosticta citribraziliensis TaxID=989973 RepID=A0ABR1M5J4_9PEZI